MTPRRHSGGGMRRKILLLAIIPALSISIILTWYFMSDFIKGLGNLSGLQSRLVFFQATRILPES